MIFLLIMLLTLPLYAEPLTENQARFAVITGDVGLLAQGAPEWIEPHEGLPIEPGDRIRTGDDGHVELALSENALWILEPKTEVVFEHTEINTGTLDLPSGTLMGIVDSERAAGTAQSWDFNTPAAVVAIRGTEFVIVATPHESTRLGVFKGTVEMEPAETTDGPQPSIQVESGHEAVSKRGHPIQSLAQFSPGIKTLATKDSFLKRRLKWVQDTWSPFTPTVRTELRNKFVAPPPKPHRVRPKLRRPRPPSPPPQ